MGETDFACDGPDEAFVVWEGVGVYEDDGDGAIALVVEFLEIFLYYIRVWKEKLKKMKPESSR